MSNPSHKSDWARLFRVACSLIEQANSEYHYIDYWTFGGGTAMMLQLHHRESHDVDIFLADPQLLGYLDPSLRGFNFEMMPSDYNRDGTNSLKLSFETGEIDFIVGQSLTNNPTINQNVQGIDVLLETIPEIITKKIFYRGGSIKARDIYDIAAGAELHGQDIVAALKEYPEKVELAIRAMDRLNPDFVNNAIQALMIKDNYRELSKTAIQRTKEVLLSV